MTTIAIHGAAGRMGRRLIDLTLEADDLTLAAAVVRGDDPTLGRDAGELVGRAGCGVRLTDTLPAVDVVVDFSSAAASLAAAEVAAGHGAALVIGTTALTADDLAALRRVAERVPVLVAPNTALGVNLLFALVRQAAEVLGLDYDVEIIETHHRHKRDAPSGTAQRLAEQVAAGLDVDLATAAVHGREGLGDERPRGQIGVHAVRGGDVVGDHLVVYAGPGERLELGHRASSRDVFAAGALRAARWIAGKPAGWYSMGQVLGLA